MKSIAPIKLCRLLVLVLCVLCPIHAFGAKTGDTIPKQDKGKDESSKQTDNKQKQSTTTGQDETLIKNLFKDATYENFAPQDEAEEKAKIFDETYLEPPK